MNARNSTVTLGPWNFGGTIEHATNRATIGPFRLREGSLFRDGKSRIQRGDWDGHPVAADFDGYRAESSAIGLRHGYIQKYGRNTCRFVMSRAARKRGLTTTDGMYNRRADRGKV